MGKNSNNKTGIFLWPMVYYANRSARRLCMNLLLAQHTSL